MFVEFLTSGDGEKCSVRIDDILFIQEYKLVSLQDEGKKILYSKHGKEHTAITIRYIDGMISVVGNYEETMAKINAVIGLEPLLGEVDISNYLIKPWTCEYCYRQIPGSNNLPDDWITVWTSCICPECQKKIEKDGGINKVVGGAYAKITDPRCSKPINWVVVGCESGKDRRPCNIEWVRDIVHQCQHYKVPVFVKQLDIDGKVVRDINKFPEDLRIREYPK